MIKYQALVDGVGRRARITDVHESREVTGVVLGVLVRAVPVDERGALVGALPGPVRGVTGTPHSGTDVPDVGDLLGEIATMLGRTPEQARRLARAVLDELGDQDARMVGRIASALPSGTVDALRAVAGNP